MPKLSIVEAGWKLGRSASSIRKDIRLNTFGYEVEKITGPGGFKYLVVFPDDEEPEVVETALASDKEIVATESELVSQLRADLANATDQIRWLEGHVSQLTNALGPAPKTKPWFKFW